MKDNEMYDRYLQLAKNDSFEISDLKQMRNLAKQ